MSNLSDKEIDRLSREAADSYEPDSSPLSWSRLEQMLIEQMPEHPPDGFRFGRLNPYIWGPAIILLAGISIFFIKNSFYSQHSTRKSEPVSQISVASGDSGRLKSNTLPVGGSSSAQNARPSDTKNINQAEKSLTTSSQTTTADNDDAETGLKSNNSKKTEIHSGNQKALVSSAGNNTGRKGSGSTVTIPSAVVVAESSASGRSVGTQGGNPTNMAKIKNATVIPNHDQSSGALASGAALSTTSTVSAGQSPTKAPVNTLPLLARSGIGLGRVSGNDSLLNKMTPSSPTPAARKSMHLNRSLNIGFAFGADYTDAGGIPNNQLSNNIGITLGYYLTPRLSVNTGIYYSNKFYWSPGHGPSGQSNAWRPPSPPGSNPTWAYAPDIEYVNGACNMYELPLTLRYDFANDDRTKFFVNAGLSSYFMLKQTYIYFFHSGGRPLAWKSNIESQSNYWFGVGDLSFGLETDMGKGFSFQAEPFFRIPLQKMGVENLKMYSYGFMISFRYAPVLSRTKK